MIIKKIATAGAGTYAPKSKGAHITDLCRYILDARHRVGERGEGEPEKVICSGYGGDFAFDGGDDARISEMIALAGGAKAAQPVDHYVMSWPDTERPTPEQVRQAVQIFVEHCGMSDHQYIYAAHDNTDNRHVHVALCRVDPTTHKTEQVNGGWYKKACQQAAARIEQTQGWRSEIGGRYAYDAATETYTERHDREDSALVQRGKTLLPAFVAATSWQDLHDRLRLQGATYAPRRGGAVVRFMGTSGDIKASQIDRSVSMAALRKRFGDFTPDQHRRVYRQPPREAVPYIPYKAGIIAALLQLILWLFGVQTRRTRTRQAQDRQSLAETTRHLPAPARQAIQEVQRQEQRAERVALSRACKDEIKKCAKMDENEQKMYLEKLKKKIKPQTQDVQTQTPVQTQTQTQQQPQQPQRQRRQRMHR